MASPLLAGGVAASFSPTAGLASPVLADSFEASFSPAAGFDSLLLAGDFRATLFLTAGLASQLLVGDLGATFFPTAGMASSFFTTTASATPNVLVCFEKSFSEAVALSATTHFEKPFTTPAACSNFSSSVFASESMFSVMLAFYSGFDVSIFWTWCFKPTLLLVFGFDYSSFVTAVLFVTYSSHGVCPAAVNLISFSVSVRICAVGTTSSFVELGFSTGVTLVSHFREPRGFLATRHLGSHNHIAALLLKQEGCT